MSVLNSRAMVYIFMLCTLGMFPLSVEKLPGKFVFDAVEETIVSGSNFAITEIENEIFVKIPEIFILPKHTPGPSSTRTSDWSSWMPKSLKGKKFESLKRKKGKNYYLKKISRVDSPVLRPEATPTTLAPKKNVFLRIGFSKKPLYIFIRTSWEK